MHPPRPQRRRATGDARGVSLSAFVAVVTLALLLMAGVVIDGGSQSAATRRCAQLAAQAARAASDAGALARAAGTDLDTGAMLVAGNAVIASSGLEGSVTISGDRVTARTSTSAPTIFLSLIGIAALPASGEATVVLQGTGG